MSHFVRNYSIGLRPIDVTGGQSQSRSLAAPVLNERNFDRSSTCSQHSGWRDFTPAILLLVTGILGLAAATLSPSGASGQYAVIAPPWYSAAQTISLIQHAGGRIAAINPGSRVVIAHSEKSGFDRDLYRAGAWLVLDPMRLRGCSKAPISTPKDAA